MSKSPAPLAMATLATHTADALAEFVVFNANMTKVTFLNVGKGLFTLEAKVGRDEAKKLLGKGVTEHTLKNARQAVNVWESVVSPGHADEAWFDQLTFMDCVMINRAIAKLDPVPAIAVKAMVEEGLFKKRPAMAYGGFELIADTGQTKAQRDAAAEKAIAEQSAKPAAQSAATGTTPPAKPAEASATPPAATASAPATSSGTTVDSVVKRIEAAEEAVLKLIDLGDEVAANKVVQRLLAAKLAADQALAKKFTAKSSTSERKHVSANAA